MESGINKKIKVVLVCHFANELVRSRLPLTQRGKNIPDFAPWITGLLNEFNNIEDIDVHVIAPYYGLKSLTFSFKDENINYCFFSADVPFLNKRWPSFFCIDKWTGYFANRIIVKRIINNIQPDIINLIGGENTYYSATILGIKNIPILVSLQGIYSNPIRFKDLKEDKIRSKYERLVYKENKYFSLNARFMEDLIKRDVTDPILLWNNYPINFNKLQNIQKQIKQYDFVMFSRLTKLKGCEDVLNALVIVKRYKPNVILRMMGPVIDSYYNLLKTKILELQLFDNVILSGEFTKQDELFKEATKASYYVLPTYIDTIPGSIFEAILLGLPVISYKTGDIPILNNLCNTILLSDAGDINNLAFNMISLLQTPQLGEELNKNALITIKQYFDSKASAFNFIEQYNAIIANYKTGKEVPSHLLNENYMK